MNQYEYCKVCLNRKFDRQSGLYCGLTGQKPDLLLDCPDFKLDEKAATLGQAMPEGTAQSKSPKKLANQAIIFGAALTVMGFGLNLFEGGDYEDGASILSDILTYCGLFVFALGIVYRIYIAISTEDSLNNEIIDNDLEDKL